MIKKTALILILFSAITACSDKTNDSNPLASSNQETTSTTNKTTETNPENTNGEEVDLTEQDMLAMDILNDEILLDECNAYALEDKVTESNLKAYLSDCVKQLKLEASVIIEEPQESAEKTESTSTKKSENP